MASIGPLVYLFGTLVSVVGFFMSPLGAVVAGLAALAAGAISVSNANDHYAGDRQEIMAEAHVNRQQTALQQMNQRGGYDCGNSNQMAGDPNPAQNALVPIFFNELSTPSTDYPPITLRSSESPSLFFPSSSPSLSPSSSTSPVSSA